MNPINGQVECIICGKPTNLVNPLNYVFLNPFICSQECLQKNLDENGMTISSSDGSKINIPPGGVIVTVNPPSQQIIKEGEKIIMDIKWDD